MQQKTSNIKRFILWPLLGFGIVGLIAILAYAADKEGSQGNSEKGGSKILSKELAPLLAVSAKDHGKGNAYSRVSLIEYSDLQCPACKAYYPILKQIQNEYGSKILIVYRHFPLNTIHQHSQIAAQASEAAANQGKFWEMHDVLFENQEIWSSQKNPEIVFIEYARKLNLDIARFTRDMNSQETKDRVADDYQSGEKLGVKGTPTFFLAGAQLLSNPQTYEEFTQLIDKALSSE